MRFFFVLLTFISLGLNAQVEYRIDSLGLWTTDLYKDSGGVVYTGKHNRYNEVWGYAANGKEYAVIGSRKGTHFLDVTDPTDIYEIAFIPGKYPDATHRDYHDYKGYLYMVCDQNPSSLQILDLKYLPDSVPLVYDSDEFFSTVHNIFIDTIAEKLYACSVNDSDGTHYDLKIFDLSESYVPKLLIEYNDAADNIDAFHDIWVRDNFGIGNNGNSGLFFYDFSSDDTVLITNFKTSYPDQGYNHAGYATKDNAYYYFSDETHGKDLKAVDIRNKDSIEIVALFNSGRSPDKTIPHNLIVHDTLLYVSYYHEGLQIYSLSNPAKPEKIAHYHTYTTTIEDISSGEDVIDYSGYKAVWGVYPFLPSGNILISDREKGLFVLGLNLEAIAPDDIRSDFKTVFPNPSNSDFYFDYPPEDIYVLNLYDVNGRIIEREMSFIRETGITKILPSGYLSGGIYILEVRAKNEDFSIKITRE